MQGEVKDLLTSKTVIGAAVAILAQILTGAGYDIGDQGLWVNHIIGLTGAAFAIFGRVKAVKKINSVAGLRIKE